jgi:beta-glucanase (GH16 family)
MSYKYGRLEMRAKIPFGAGAFPSLWLSSRDAMGYKKMCEYSTEIDVFEVFGKTADANRLEACIHKWYNKDGVKTKDECSCGTGYLKGNGYEIDVEKRSQIIEKTAQDEFHTIVFDWTENTMTFSVDGKVYYTATRSEMDNASQGIGFAKVTGFDITGYKTSNDGIFNQYLSVLLTNSMYTTGAGAAYDYEGNASEIVPENLSFEIDYIRLYQKNDGISEINLK